MKYYQLIFNKTNVIIILISEFINSLYIVKLECCLEFSFVKSKILMKLKKLICNKKKIRKKLHLLGMIFTFRNIQQCCQEPRMLYEDVSNRNKM